MTITSNIEAPNFSLSDEKGNIVNLTDFRGKNVLLYFYPKDDTPGCTTEACNFRDDYSAYEQIDVVILGVSPDSEKSHLKFKEKYQIPFSLLSDTGHKVCEVYGVWGRKKMMGREYYGVLRTTFLIDKKGIITFVFEGVKPSEHSKEVLDKIKNLV